MADGRVTFDRRRCGKCRPICHLPLGAFGHTDLRRKSRRDPATRGNCVQNAACTQRGARTHNRPLAHARGSLLTVNGSKELRSPGGGRLAGCERAGAGHASELVTAVHLGLQAQEVRVVHHVERVGTELETLEDAEFLANRVEFQLGAACGSIHFFNPAVQFKTTLIGVDG